MKETIKIFFILLSYSLTAQVGVNTTIISNGSVSLEFGSGNRGIILPWVDEAAKVTGAVGGTLVYDALDKKVKYYNGTSWVDLSVDNTGTVDLSLQKNLVEQPLAKVSIGGTVSSTPGILILEDSNKAMILPKVSSPHLSVINPAAGLIVYDTKKKQLAIFNGSVWTFWK